MKSIQHLLILLFIPIVANAQYDIGVNLKVYNPTGQLDKNIENLPVGFSLTGFRRIKDKFSIGTELGVSMYANDTRQHELREEGYPGQYTEVNEEDCFWTAHLIGQYNLRRGDFYTLYAEGRLGITTFFSAITSTDYDDRFEDEFEFHGTALNTAMGMGVLLDPFKNKGWGIPVKLDLAINMHSGSRADYRNFESKHFDPQNPKFESLTNYLDYRVGILVGIGQ